MDLHSLGLHCQLKQQLASKYENFTSLIQIAFKDFEAACLKYETHDLNNLSLSMFESASNYYIDKEKSFTLQSLVNDFELQRELSIKNASLSIPYKYEQNSNSIMLCQFQINGVDFDVRMSKLPISERKRSRTFVFLNKYFKEGLNIQFEENGLTWNEAYIDNQLYYYFFN